MRRAHAIFQFILGGLLDFCGLELSLFCHLKAKPVVNGGRKSVHQ